ncbi:DgyrCDS6822 [Dimorphilus gyrociliatus]|uniref:DgyrCDS6822 n=1 Tax=Dimorphilus gyrociliatus TaxID=2664684 RepID=A0A7I8VQR8_9ANNE|nr:DgyrCDS6822 [Dimorphilus gyrociliatus]
MNAIISPTPVLFIPDKNSVGKIFYHKPEGDICRLKISKLNVLNAHHLQTNGDKGQYSLTVDPSVHITSGLFLATVFLNCISKETLKTYTSNTVNVFAGEPENQIGTLNDDPHFLQSVRDSNTKNFVRICYDVVGESNQYIFIAGNRHLNISIYGVLRDDYYMSSVIIKTSAGEVVITVDGVIVNNRLIELDSLDPFNIDTHDFHISESEKGLAIKHHHANFPTIYIYHQTNDVSSRFLNFELSSLYQIDTGVMGTIEQKMFEFYERVQENSFAGAVKVDHFLNRAWLAKRGRNECWLVDTNDLLRPLTINNFIKSTV